MPDIESPMDRALKLVLALFPAGRAKVEDIAKNCEDVLGLLQIRGEEAPELNALIREVESRVVVWQERSTSLEDRTGHEDWLAAERENIKWSFWDRYRRYLEQVELLPPAVISRLDDSTFRVLEKLENPGRVGEWDRRGMVVGHVQSGKTSHYTSLACKAADAGYKLIVVLTGTHDSLRSQTQLRLDEGLLGFDTQFQSRTDENKQTRIGVGALPGVEALKIGSITSSKAKGDFTGQRADNFSVPIGEMPILLVIKKYGSILDNLHGWVTKLHGEQIKADSDEKRIRDIPLLVIDDEADNASINTKNPDEEPTAINRKIRKLLKAFDKSSYVPTRRRLLPTSTVPSLKTMNSVLICFLAILSRTSRRRATTLAQAVCSDCPQPTKRTPDYRSRFSAKSTTITLGCRTDTRQIGAQSKRTFLPASKKQSIPSFYPARNAEHVVKRQSTTPC